MELIDKLQKRLANRKPQRGLIELRPAAVLIPLILASEGHRLLFTVRASNLRRQPGEISFPGGAVDVSDSSLLATALRESWEEVGLESKYVSVLGQMDERGTSNGFRITPFVGAIQAPYQFKANYEVQELLEVPLESLNRQAPKIKYRKHSDGSSQEMYHYIYGHYDIWGITGQLVKEFLDLIE